MTERSAQAEVNGIPVPADPQRARILELLREMAEALEALQDDYAETVGLHRTDLDALTHLSDSAEPLSMRALGQRLSLTPGAVTGLVDRLERMGHVQRTPDAADRRRINVELSRKARAVGDRFFTDLASRLLAVLEPFDDAELDVIERFVERLPQALDPSGRAGR